MQDNIENIKLKQLWSLPIEKQQSYLNILQCLKSKNKIGKYKIYDLEELPYADVVLIQSHFHSAMYDDCLTAMSLSTKQPKIFIEKFCIVEFSHGWNYISDMISEINKKMQLLVKPPKPMLIDAGIEKLNMFGELNVLTALAKEYSTTPFEVEQWPWGFVYALQLKNKIESDINDDDEILMKAKSENK